jgi:hypothetical protein
LRWNRVSPELATWVVLALCAPLVLSLPVTNDSAWQMWLGRQILHGANLYTDLIEVNPPLWFWMAAPLAWIAETLAVPSRIVLLAFLLTAIATSFALCASLIRDWPKGRRLAFCAAFAVTTIAIPLPIFTQREHFVLVSTIPYVLLCAAREAKRPVSTSRATMIGLFAALGFAIKPFFAIVPIALEWWLWHSQRRLRPETVSLGGMALAYTIAVLLAEPDYLAAVPKIALTYHYFVAGNYRGFVLPLVLFALAAIPLARRNGTATAFLIAALVYLLCFYIQGKSWSYQALPAIGMLIFALSACPLGRSALRDGVVLGILATAIWVNARIYQTDRPFTLPEGSAVASLSLDTRPVWPQVEERGYRWPLRSMSLWQLGAIENGAIPPGPLQSEVAHDLECNPPDYLVIHVAPPVEHFLQASPDLREVLGRYRQVATRDELRLLRRSGAMPARPADCRTIY